MKNHGKGKLFLRDKRTELRLAFCYASLWDTSLWDVSLW